MYMQSYVLAVQLDFIHNKVFYFNLSIRPRKHAFYKRYARHIYSIFLAYKGNTYTNYVPWLMNIIPIVNPNQYVFFHIFNIHESHRNNYINISAILLIVK